MMAHSRPASRHGRYDAFRTEFSTETAADELPSQSVFSYDGTEDVRHTRENRTIQRQKSAKQKAMAHGVVPSGPVVAVHMFDVSSDKSDSRESSPTQSAQLRRWSRETLDGTEGFPPASPRPPSTPRSSRPGSFRRRSKSGQRPGSQRRPQSSQRSSYDYNASAEEPLPPMTTLRPQSSLGKYHVLPSITPDSEAVGSADYLTVDPISSSRSDGSEDQRGTEEMEYLTSRLAHQALVEKARRNSREGEGDGATGEPDRRASREEMELGGGGAAGEGGRGLAVDGGRRSSSQRRNSSSRRDEEASPIQSSTPRDRNRDRDQDRDRDGDRRSVHRGSSASSTLTSPEPMSARSHTSISHYQLDEAPKPQVEGQVLLGIKIPTSGTRHKHYFNSRDQLRCIVLFAEEVSGEDFSNHVLVLATRRRRFDNLSQTIEDAGLETKSVIHLEEVD